MKDKGFILDYSRCVGCHACIVGCYNENKTDPPMAWRQINTFNHKKIPLAGFLNLSIACNHCSEAPCLKACPANAYFRDELTGAVIHQPEKCIGCKYCTWACPYDAPKYNLKKGIVEKCHLCNHLITKELNPACANQCPTGALSFGYIDKTDSTEPFGIPTTKFKPRLKTLHSSVWKNIPEMDISISGYSKSNSIIDKQNDKVHAFAEWPLIVFTFIFSFLSGWIVSFKLEDSLIQKGIFISLGFFAILLSTFHLGKPIRAARSVLNLRTSWLSREILFSGLFILFSIVYFFINNSTFILLVSLLLSILLLLSIEKVYSITEKKYMVPIHSANTFLTAILFGLCFYGLFKISVVVIVIKALLYLIRKKDIESLNQTWVVIGLLTRIIIGFLIPLSILLFSNPINFSVLLSCIILGELIDRIEFYNDLYINSPSRVLNQALKSELD